MHLKSAVAAAAIALVAGGASAQSISFVPSGDVTFNRTFDPDGGVFASGQYTSGTLGTLIGDNNAGFTLTYLGQESAFSDRVTIEVNGQTLTEFDSIGDTIFGPMVAGQPLDFTFFGEMGSFAENGGDKSEHASFVLLDRDLQTNFGTFAYVLGYNDSALHDDWDDFVVGVNPIPEPSTYALLLAGLGVVGFVARRRQSR